jgi:hypothetical protein
MPAIIRSGVELPSFEMIDELTLEGPTAFELSEFRRSAPFDAGERPGAEQDRAAAAASPFNSGAIAVLLGSDCR